MSADGRWPNALTRGDLLGGVAPRDLAEDGELAFGERQPGRSHLTPTCRDRPARSEAERDGDQLAQTHAL